MSRSLTILVVPAANEAEYTTYVRDSLALPFRDTVRVLTDSVSAAYSTDVNESVSADLIESLSTIPVDAQHQLFLHRDAKCSIEKFRDWWADQGFLAENFQVQSQKNIRALLKRRWEQEGYHWLTHAKAQTAMFEGQRLSIEAWVEQFGKLGHQSIGRKIAAQLRVIRPTDMPSMPFALREPETIGLQQANCYVEDDDIGGSWQDIKAILSHTHPKGSVHSVAWDKVAESLTFPDIQVDQFVLHEDGLWTGTEGVRRLKALLKNPPGAQVILKFGVVCDFGLYVLRHAISALGLSGKVHIDTSASEYMQFLSPELPEDLRLARNSEHDAYFEALQGYALPRAFLATDDWTEDEKRVCSEIGAQLVTEWLGLKTGMIPDHAAVNRFALGGSGFASTTVFARSVPKVCLPALWLDGKVEIMGKTVNWRPLFVDARRVSDASLLFAPSR